MEATYRTVAWTEYVDLDGVLMESDGHYLAAWTLMVNGKREVVALQLHPRGHVTLDERWLWEATVEVANGIPNNPEPITTLLVRAIPLGRVVNALRQARGPSVVHVDSAFYDYPHLSPAKLGYLVDAFVYANEVGRGSDSPAKAVAAQRGIDVRSAHNRIAKARQLGYLTPGAHGKVGGELTEVAKGLEFSISRWLEERTAVPSG